MQANSFDILQWRRESIYLSLNIKKSAVLADTAGKREVWFMFLSDFA